MTAEHLTLYIKKYLLDCSCKFIFINVIVNCLDIKNYKGKKEKEKEKEKEKIPQRTTPRAMPKAWQLNLVYNECYVAWECDGADGADKS